VSAACERPPAGCLVGISYKLNVQQSPAGLCANAKELGEHTFSFSTRGNRSGFPATWGLKQVA
jgi:hypothetical protein